MRTSFVRFEDFELDYTRFELRRAGRVLKLEKIPMELLILLVEREGHLVPRQEIIDRLWGKDVFIDADHGINTAVRKIRSVLRDNPERPRFIQTVTGKGYRFIANQVSVSEAIDGTNGGPQPANPELVSEVERELSFEEPRLRASGASALEGLGRVPTRSHSVVIPAAISSPAPPSATSQEGKRFFREHRLGFGLLALLSVALVSYLAWKRTRPELPEDSRPVMLAVLPFDNLGKDPVEDYFSDGLTEEVITQLGALSPGRLGVIARTTSMAYKQTRKNVGQIGRELAVDYVLESSIRRDGDQVRISSQLIRVRDQIQVWAGSYDREVGHSLALQEELAKAVAEQVRVRIDPTHAVRSAAYPLDAQANEAYLRGRYFWNQFTADGYKKAIEYFDEAIRRDPNFAEAYSGLSDSYYFLAVTDAIPFTEGESRALDSANRALALDDSLAESHVSLANLKYGQWKWPEAEAEFKRAIALNPSYSPARRIYAAFLATQRRHRQAWEQIEVAMRLDPLCLPNNAEVVRTLYYARDYEAAIQRGQKALQLDPNFSRTHFWLGRAYAQKGMYPEAISEAEKVLQGMPDSTMALTELAYSLGTAGRHPEARKLLRHLEQRSTHVFVPAYDLAIIHVALKENEQALGLLQKGYEEHDWALLAMAAEPRLDPLRSDPRYQELSTKLGFHF